MSEPGDITALLAAWRQGDEASLAELIPIAYRELHRLAVRSMRGEQGGHTLQPTALVHEAFLRLVGEQDRDWQNRAHFFGVAANIMRNLLIDYARARKRGKRGGGAARVFLEEAPAFAGPDLDELLALEEALKRLEEFDQRAARVVELRYFAGLRLDEVALVLDISEKTVRRDWTLARTWLQAELRSVRADGKESPE